jgi:hypothetical protein
MYLVGHAIVAFLIGYAISKKFKVVGVSFALVLVISCLPDIDILFESVGIMSHKTYTHSFVLSLVVVPSVIFAIARWRRLSAGVAFIYSLAYIQHIAIGDIAIGSINILYPFGNLMLGTGIGYGTLAHQTIEYLLLAVAAGIIVNKSFSGKTGTTDPIGLFRYQSSDKVGYLLFIGSLAVSFAYLLYGIKILPRFFVETDLEMALFVLLHLAAIALVAFWTFVSKQESLILARQAALSKKG